MTYKGYLVWFLNRNYENVMFEGKKDHDLPFVVYRPFVVYLPVFMFWRGGCVRILLSDFQEASYFLADTFLKSRVSKIFIGETWEGREGKWNILHV